MAEYPIYRSSHGGQDVHVGDVDAFCAVAALEQWATDVGITDYSVDQRGSRRYICPADSVLFFYTYAEA